MKMTKMLSLILGTGLILGSCMTSNNVVNNKLISKRKYTKGFFINGKGNFKSGGQEQEKDQLAIIEKPVQDHKVGHQDFQTRAVATINSSTYGDLQAKSENKSVSEVQVKNVESKEQQKQQAERVIEKKEIAGYKVKDLKLVQKELKSKSAPSPVDDTAMLIILVILAIIIPPLAVFIYEGATNRFWIDLILAIIGWGVGFWLLGGLGFLCGLAAVIYALLIVLEAI